MEAIVYRPKLKESEFFHFRVIEDPDEFRKYRML